MKDIILWFSYTLLLEDGYVLPCSCVEYSAIAMIAAMDPELLPHIKLYNSEQVPLWF